MMKKILLAVAALMLAVSVSAQTDRHEVSASYGLLPSSVWLDRYASDWINVIFGEDSSDASTWGAVTLGYNYRLTNKFSVGLQLVYSGNDIKEKNKTVTHSNYFSVMPNVKWNWVDAKMVSLYSRAGVGLAFATWEGTDEKLSKTLFAFQLSLIGIEVGNRLAGYAEAGLGNSGSLLFGVRYRF